MPRRDPTQPRPCDIRKREERLTGTKGAFNWVRNDRPSAEALRQRDEYRASLQDKVMTPNQRVLGDPMPGRSALDRRNK